MTVLPIRVQLVVVYASADGIFIAEIPMITANGASERAIPVAAPFRLDPVALALALVAMVIVMFGLWRCVPPMHIPSLIDIQIPSPIRGILGTAHSPV